MNMHTLVGNRPDSRAAADEGVRRGRGLMRAPEARPSPGAATSERRQVAWTTQPLAAITLRFSQFYPLSFSLQPFV